MERNLCNYPSFLKLLMEEDFSKEIRIPNNFARKYFKNKLPKKCLLKCAAGGGNKSWPVRMRRKGKNDDVLYICEDAWPNFVRDQKLKYGDYVLFWLVDKSTFVVITYGSDSNRKFDFSYDEKSESDSPLEDDGGGFDPSDGNRVIKEEDGSGREETVDRYEDYYRANLENPYFVKKFRPSHERQMAIPAGFIKETKLDFKETVVLHGEDDREWTVRIWRSGNKRLIMTEGWISFLRGFRPKIGDRYKFTLLRNLSNVFTVERISLC